jgi:regulator of sigma E protease
MSGVLVQAIQLLMALSLLIILHEGGHFFFARLFKTRVEKFYLFFDFLFPFSNVMPFSLFKKKIGETQWGIGWFPLGGYVKIAGMVDESMDKEQLAKPPEPWEFRAKKPWQRLFIMLGGIIVNVLLAFVIYAMVLFVWGEQRLPVADMSHGIMVTDSLAYKMGFQNGDKIVSVDGKSYQYYDEVKPELLYAKTVEIDRNGAKQSIHMPTDWVGNLTEKGLFEISAPAIIDEVEKGSGVEKAGLKNKDMLVSVNGIATPSLVLFKNSLQQYKGKKVTVGYTRAGKSDTVEVQVTDAGTIGFLGLLDMDYLKEIGYYHPVAFKYGFFQSFPSGVKLGVETIKGYWRQLGLLVHFKNGAYKQTGGFVSIAKIYSKSWDWLHFWNVTAFISIALAIMNLLPIPGLDGGYVVFTLIEMVTGRKVNEKVLEIATTIGLVLLLTLMVLVNGHDIFKLFGK